ncbi:hypothetical protein GCM10023353_23890 [Tomitella cavernea]|uniref:Uncharacterized protein n=1 Tax=Tomitella cavernea TaxID=1387982 RepID=A0ABP9CQX3_9ACTN
MGENGVELAGELVELALGQVESRQHCEVCDLIAGDLRHPVPLSGRRSGLPTGGSTAAVRPAADGPGIDPARRWFGSTLRPAGGGDAHGLAADPRRASGATMDRHRK